jgi:5-methylcytosine-specific restriction endonuclease McrA
MGRQDFTKIFCSRQCAEELELRTNGRLMRRFIFERDLGCCAECGRRWPTLDSEFHIDHERPLFLAADDWTCWDPENQRILCIDPCHKNKTAEERTLMKPARRARITERLRNKFGK